MIFSFAVFIAASIKVSCRRESGKMSAVPMVKAVDFRDECPYLGKLFDEVCDGF